MVELFAGVVIWWALCRHSACSNVSLSHVPKEGHAWLASDASKFCFLLCAVRQCPAGVTLGLTMKPQSARATREWNAAEAAKDLEKCLSFYADDGERFAAGSSAIRGAAALRNEWRKYLNSPG